MNLHNWALKWRIPAEAIAEFKAAAGMISTEPPNPKVILTENGLQAAIRLNAAKRGARLWRNNTGAATDANGNFIRYGLANDSKAMNERIKSSDLIGINPVYVTEPQWIGQFVAREVKVPGWTYKGTAREKAQLAFLELVLSLGGDAAFATRGDTI